MASEPGQIRPSRRTITPATPSVNPAAFGAGVGQALGSLAQTATTAALLGQQQDEANTTLDLAYKMRQDKLLSSQLNVEFINLQNNLSLSLAEKYKAADPGAPGFTNQVNADVNAAFDAFVRKIPERMLPDFESRIATTKNALTTSAFSLQVDAENTEFKRNVGLLQNDVVNRMMTTGFTDPGQLDVAEAQALADFDKLFASSPLTKIETRDLREQTVVALKSVKLARIAKGEAEGLWSNGGAVPGQLETSGTVVKSTKPVASGLPAYAVGFLTSIAGPESGGEYNAMYSPGDRRHFQDFSKHPNDSATIHDGPHEGQSSSAAGKYMMIKDTWDRAAAALGLSDFSPENQDLAAWYIAQSDYFEKTGRNLNAVLASGDPGAILEAKRVLSSTWVVLGNGAIGDQQFLDAINNATGNPSSLIYDEEFYSIPYDQRVAIVMDAQTKAVQAQSQMAAEQKAQQNAQLEAMKQSIAAGDAGQADINSATRTFGFSYDQQKELEKVLRETDTQKYDANQFVNKAQQPGFTVTTEEDKSQAASFYSQLQMDTKLAEMDGEFVKDILLPVSAQTHYVPPNVVHSLQSLTTSANQNQALFALETLNQLRGVAGAEFDRAFSPETQKAVSLYNWGKASLPTETLLQYIRNQNDPAMKPIIEAREKQVAQNVKDNPDDFTAAGIADYMDYGGDISQEVGTSMFAEFWPLYNYLHSATGDHQTAMRGAADILKNRYADFSYNGTTQFLRYPPNLTGKPWNGGYDYMDEQIKSFYGLSEDQRTLLVSDPQTEKEHLSGQGASYKLMKIDENGLIAGPYLERDLPGFNPREDHAIANRIVRWEPKVTPQMFIDQVDLNVKKDKLQQLRKERASLFFFGDKPAQPLASTLDTQRIGELTKQIAELEGDVQYEAPRENFYSAPKFYKPLKNVLTGFKNPQISAMIKEVDELNPTSFADAGQKLIDLRVKLLSVSSPNEAQIISDVIAKMLKELGNG